MSYELQAVLAKTETLRASALAYQNAHVVVLAQDLAMIPLTDELFEEIGGNGQRDQFYKFSPELECWINRISQDSPVAYVEAEYFGGVGCQNALVLINGTRTFGPLHADDAINQALSHLGISVKETAIDGFSTVGLDKHRATGDWVQGRKQQM
jgi:hypothetical protein